MKCTEFVNISIPGSNTDDDDKIGEEDNQNSPIIWLGKFMFNGLPSKLFNFKNPFSSMYWHDSLKDLTSYPSTNIISRIFSGR